MNPAQLYPELNAVRLACVSYRLHCIAHRMRKFGFETSVNKLAPRDLLYLSTMVLAYQRQHFIAEAYRRDPSLANLGKAAA